jgi:hypothetical protein
MDMAVELTMTSRRRGTTIEEATMLSTLTTGTATLRVPGRSGVGSNALRSLARALAIVRQEHSVALRAAAEAEMPGRQRAALQKIYTARKKGARA